MNGNVEERLDRAGLLRLGISSEADLGRHGIDHFGLPAASSVDEPGLGQQVGRDQGPEQQALRTEEQPHRQLHVRQAEAAGVIPRDRASVGCVDRSTGASVVRHLSVNASALLRCSWVAVVRGRRSDRGRRPARAPNRRDQHHQQKMPGIAEPQAEDDAVADDRASRPPGPDRPVRGAGKVDTLAVAWLGQFFAGVRPGEACRPRPSAYLRCQKSSSEVTIGVGVVVVARGRRLDRPLDACGRPTGRGRRSAALTAARRGTRPRR